MSNQRLTPGELFTREHIKRTSTVDQVCAVLRERILSGELPPGTPLREVVLSESLGVARNTVREAVRRLEAEGLVVHRIHRGAMVATLTPSDVHEIFALRRLIEFEALRRCSDEDADRLGALADRMLALVPGGEAAAIVDADMRFHEALVDSLGNSRLTPFFANNLAELRIVLCLVEDGDAPEWVPLHREVCRLVRRGDRGEAIALLDTHFVDTESLLAETAAATGDV
jgi:DNA-binding GntR family transcriptional regulator